MPLPRPRIYIASKVHRAAAWRALRDSGLPIEIVSTWIDAPQFAPEDVAEFRSLWTRCIDEARKCDLLIAVAEEGETFKGVLVEIGAALAAGNPVYLVGTCASLRAGDGSDASFVHHPMVRRGARSVLDAASLWLLGAYRVEEHHALWSQRESYLWPLGIDHAVRAA